VREEASSLESSAAFAATFENLPEKSSEPSSPAFDPAATAVAFGSPIGEAVGSPAVRTSHVSGRKSAKMAPERLSRQKSGESQQVSFYNYEFFKRKILQIYFESNE
jgi:hypothetical protein